MDLMNRGLRPNQQPTSHESPAHHHPAEPEQPKPSKRSRLKNGNFTNITYISLLFSVTIVLVGLLFALVLSSNRNKEESFVDASKFQAVFLNNGQVYFGHINELNKDYMSVSDIYYLRVNQQVQPDRQAAAQNDVSLVKLGCELHGPQDSMVVNRDQVTFWENLKEDGQVAKAVAEYVKANPNGQNCEQQKAQSTSTGSSSTNSSNGTNSSSNSTESTGNTSNTPAGTNGN
jgi:hypothetical protein